MRRKIVWRAGVFVAFAFGGSFVPSTSDFAFPGVSSAEAKPFYTRKRVNGRWITGRFPKRNATYASASKQAEPSPAPKPAAKATAASTTAAAASAAPVTASRPQPTVQPAQPLPTTPAAPAAPHPTASAQIPAARPIVSAALVPAPEEQRLTKLRQALQARANALTTGSIPADPRPAPEPQSVSLDFKSGMKTTVFSDGTTVKEPFDVAAMKGLAATAPEAKIGPK
jgi:hypothetical protein